MRTWSWEVEGAMGVKADHAVIRCDGEYVGVWALDHDPQAAVDALNAAERATTEKQVAQILSSAMRHRIMADGDPDGVFITAEDFLSGIDSIDTTA